MPGIVLNEQIYGRTLPGIDALCIPFDPLDKWVAVQLFSVYHFTIHNAAFGEGFPNGNVVNIIEIVTFRLGVKIVSFDKLCNTPLYFRPCQLGGLWTSRTDDKEMILITTVLVSKPYSSFLFTSVLLHIPHYGVFTSGISVPCTERIVYIIQREWMQQTMKPLIASIKNLPVQAATEFRHIRKQPDKVNIF